MNNERWSIFIDVEGFSFLHKNLESEAHRRLNNLIMDIYKIGTEIYPEEPDRLFVHQLGDGFVIVSSFPEETLYRPISIALALLKSAIINGGVLKAGISNGNFADVSGMWPQVIRDNRVKDTSTLRLGGGIMNLFSVMGEALINSYRTVNTSESGPHLVIDRRLDSLMPDGLEVFDQTESLSYLDWVDSSTELSNTILEKLGYEPSTGEIKARLEKYIRENDLSVEWISNAHKYLENE